MGAATWKTTEVPHLSLSTQANREQFFFQQAALTGSVIVADSGRLFMTELAPMNWDSCNSSNAGHRTTRRAHSWQKSFLTEPSSLTGRWLPSLERLKTWDGNVSSGLEKSIPQHPAFLHVPGKTGGTRLISDRRKSAAVLGYSEAKSIARHCRTRHLSGHSSHAA